MLASAPAARAVAAAPTHTPPIGLQSAAAAAGAPAAPPPDPVADALRAGRVKLSDSMDALIAGAATLQRQLQSLHAPEGAPVRAIKEHVRDETEDFAAAAVVVSLRVNQLWAAASLSETVGPSVCPRVGARVARPRPPLIRDCVPPCLRACPQKRTLATRQSHVFAFSSTRATCCWRG